MSPMVLAHKDTLQKISNIVDYSRCLCFDILHQFSIIKLTHQIIRRITYESASDYFTPI